MMVRRTPNPSDNVDEVFILNAARDLPGGIEDLRAALQKGLIQTIVRDRYGTEAPGPAPSYWKSAAGEHTLLTTGVAEVPAGHRLQPRPLTGDVFVPRSSLARVRTAAGPRPRTIAPSPALAAKLAAHVAERMANGLGPILREEVVAWARERGVGRDASRGLYRGLPEEHRMSQGKRRTKPADETGG